MNPLEILHDAFKPFLDGKKPPLNVLEVGNLWKYLAGGINTLRNEQIYYNTVEDDELRQKLKDAAEFIHQPIVQELSEFLEAEGIPLPKRYFDMPLGEHVAVPQGAKLSDEEVANLMSYNLLLALNYGMRGLTESLRADVGYYYSKWIIREMTFSLTFKELMQKRGWLQAPPPYTSPH